MKKILVAILACAMIMSLAACGSKKDESSSVVSSSEISSSEGVSSETSSSVMPSTPPSEESSATDPAKTDAEALKFYEAETKKVEDAIKAGLASGKPATPVEKMDDKLQASYEEVKKALGENYIPSAPIEAVQLKEIYGIGEDLIENVIAEGPMISVHVDTFIAIKAKEGKGEEVEKALTAYREKLLADTMQYPMNLPKIQSSKVIRDGDYVYFTLLGAMYE